MSAKRPASQYLFFSLVELGGMGLILWDGLPIYRQLFELQRVGTLTDELVPWVGVVAVQVSYWYALRHPPPAAIPRQVFAGHVLVFVSRLSFVFASSFFALVIYRHPDAFQFKPARVLLFMAVLFSVFCFSRHIEAIGNLMLKPNQAAAATKA